MALPIPCVLAVLSVRTADIKKAAIQTGNGIGRIGPETLILVCSTTLGAVFEAALPQMGLLNWLKFSRAASMGSNTNHNHDDELRWIVRVYIPS